MRRCRMLRFESEELESTLGIEDIPSSFLQENIFVYSRAHRPSPSIFFSSNFCSNCHMLSVNNLEDAHESIDTAISTALKESKPVYISISCNLPAITHPTFCQEHVPFSLALKVSNKLGLEVVVAAAAEFLNKAVKPVMVEGPKLQVAKASDAFVELADASGFAVVVMPSAKGLVPEHHPHFIGLEHLRVSVDVHYSQQYRNRIAMQIGKLLVIQPG